MAAEAQTRNCVGVGVWSAGILPALWAAGILPAIHLTMAALREGLRLSWLLLILVNPWHSFGDDFRSFEDFLKQYQKADSGNRAEIAASFVNLQQTRGGFPIIAADGSVLFFFLAVCNASFQLAELVRNRRLAGWKPALQISSMFLKPAI